MRRNPGQYRRPWRTKAKVRAAEWLPAAVKFAVNFPIAALALVGLAMLCAVLLGHGLDVVRDATAGFDLTASSTHLVNFVQDAVFAVDKVSAAIAAAAGAVLLAGARWRSNWSARAQSLVRVSCQHSGEVLEVPTHFTIKQLKEKAVRAGFFQDLFPGSSSNQLR